LSAKFIPHHLDRVISEEHGAKLGDSLGNAYSVFPELCKAYAATDRTEKLRPDKFHHFDRFSRSFFTNMGQKALAQFFFLEIENAFQTMDIPRLITLGEDISRHQLINMKKIITKSPNLSLDIVHIYLALSFFHRERLKSIIADREKLKAEHASLLLLHNDVTEHVYELRRVIEGYEKQSQQLSTGLRRAVRSLRLRWRA
jgi:hypothetical protein